MNKSKLLILAICMMMVTGAFAQNNRYYKLWYNQPAEKVLNSPT